MVNGLIHFIYCFFCSWNCDIDISKNENRYDIFRIITVNPFSHLYTENCNIWNWSNKNRSFFVAQDEDRDDAIDDSFQVFHPELFRPQLISSIVLISRLYRLKQYRLIRILSVAGIFVLIRNRLLCISQPRIPLRQLIHSAGVTRWPPQMNSRNNREDAVSGDEWNSFEFISLFLMRLIYFFILFQKTKFKSI